MCPLIYQHQHGNMLFVNRDLALGDLLLKELNTTTSIQSNVFDDIQVQTESQYLSLDPKRSLPEMKCKSG